MIYWIEVDLLPASPTTTDQATAENWIDQLGYGELASCLECEL